MYDVPGRVVMRDPDAVPTYGNEAGRHLLEEAVHVHAGPLVVVTAHPACFRGAVLLHRLLEGFFGGQRKRRLLDVEKDADLTVADRGIALPVFLREIVVLFTGNPVLPIRLALVFIPVVPDERNTFLSGLDCFIAFLGPGKGRIQVGLVSVPVAVESEDKRVERGDRDISGIKSRSTLSVCIEKAAAFRACPLQRFGQQFLLALRGILF